MEYGEGRVLTNLVSQAIVSKCFCVLPQSDLFYSGNVELSFLKVFLGRFPAKSLEVCVQSEKNGYKYENLAGLSSVHSQLA